jgi:two-component system sensor histidine kinase RegB
MPNHEIYQTHTTARQNLYRLGLIRAVVLLGQVLALVYFSYFNPIGLPTTSIGLVLAIYTSVTIATLYRSRLGVPVADMEFFIHLLVDIGFFSILLYLSGGASNPFISYYLIPISIAAITLPRRYTIIIAAVALAFYSLLLIYHVPVIAIAPHGGHGHGMGGNNLHILGMWANFAVSAVIITYFVSRIANALKYQQQAIAKQRETQLQDEQLLAVGTLAAGTAHELGTPINTMKLLVDEMLAQQDPTYIDDLELLNQQIEQCKITLKQLQITAEQSMYEDYPQQPLLSYFDYLLERWQLMRPQLSATINYADSQIPAPQLKFHPTIGQSILNLLNNAADASPKSVEVAISWTENEVQIQIVDQGLGVDPNSVDSIGKPFFSSKKDGLGLGLFLSQTTVTRFGGTVSLQNITQGGTLTTINLPVDLSQQTAENL